MVVIILFAIVLVTGDGTEIRLSSGQRDIWSKDSDFSVCAACLATGRPADTSKTRSQPNYWDGQLCQWWVAATRESSLHRELLGAKSIFFELDNGSGLGDACRGEEAAIGAERTKVVSGLLARCPSIVKLITLSGGSERQTAFPIYNIYDDRCIAPPARPR